MCKMYENSFKFENKILFSQRYTHLANHKCSNNFEKNIIYNLGVGVPDLIIF